MPNSLLQVPSSFLRRTLVGHVVAVFNDRARGEKPVLRSSSALYPPDSVIWRVHADVTTMMIGGVAALLMQMLHPAALAGVWEHSSFRADMLGRLRRTARFIAVTTYGDRREAEAAIARVRSVHESVRGTLADGTHYAATDPRLLAWVHVCEATGFLDAWIRYGEPEMTLADQNTYFREAALVARALGADPVPETRAEAEALVRSFRPELAAGEQVRAVAEMILTQPAPTPAAQPIQAMLMQAAVDILPRWARAMHGRDVPLLARPIVRTGTLALSRMLRWAFEPHIRSVASST